MQPPFDLMDGVLPVSLSELRIQKRFEVDHLLLTVRLETGEQWIPRDYPGRSVKVGVFLSGRTVWKTLPISSSPTESRFIDLTLHGPFEDPVANFLRQAQAGECVKVVGPIGDFYFDPEQHCESLLLVAQGPGVIPVVSMARFLEETGGRQNCRLVQFARTDEELCFRDECRRLASTVSGLDYRERTGVLDAGLECLVGDFPDDWMDRRVFLVTDKRSAGTLRSNIGKDVMKIHCAVMP